MERCRQHFISKQAPHLTERIQTFAESSATVELAAIRLGCDPAHIAKSLSFLLKKPKSKAEAKAHQKMVREVRTQQQDGSGAAGGDRASASPASQPTATAPDDTNIVVIVAAGDAKVSTKKYKEKFACQPKMLKHEEVEPYTGFPPGGVCPFGLHDDVRVYLDVSLKRFPYVYPAAGTTNTGIKVTVDELEQYASNAVEWVDLCEGWQPEEAVAAATAEKATADGSSTIGVVQDAGVAAKKVENEASKSAEATA
ncbi:conserved hypothetical protein [Leishmania major strain Friedlin]|uniref:YbaK/aminoacyl-tRNA synthetase-associated domain-containing protein n=1 Tax=Leishmania major TaxID=5664 RepID=E9ACL6_LEIMA|nr:conserved hypothetical protein [Leishmania major strain Friedlin]CAG9567297.1 Aminoacyl-tRNA_editing_domain_containing_protein_-_putative [Leishmania major strain Friedlin]CBZ12033.1 conserved hypothetical protein [Leishmania major strain Friedlin]|eukprot:XP_003721747.1 conserved hypothetical protein [Leishmania major strain Friedlin]